MMKDRMRQACVAWIVFCATLVGSPVHAAEGGALSSLGRMLGITGGGGDNVSEDVPKLIAVLPAVGEGTRAQRDDIRTVIHNSLSSKNFELKKPHEIDLALVTSGLNPEALQDQDPETLIKALGTEGLVYVDVLAVKKIYAGAYASQEVSVRLRLYSAAKKTFIWEKVDSQIDREGGLSLNVLGILTTMVTSTKVLTEGVRQALVDRMARKFADEIPQPPGRTKVSPPNIMSALTNAEDGPFRAGDEIIVYMKGEPGLGVTFDLGIDRPSLPMREKAPGEYVGTYVVKPDDNAENQLVLLHANRVSPRGSMEWRVPGRISMDNVPPKGVLDFKARPVTEGVKLSWRPDGVIHDAPIYAIERSDPETGAFSPLAEIATYEYVDRSVVIGKTYHYRITPRDAAENRGPVASTRVLTVAPGPTKVSGEILEDRIFQAFGGPYQLEGEVKVGRTATLTIEPGVVLEFADTAKLEVLGGLQVLGSDEQPVLFKGSQWQLRINDTGKRMQAFHHARFEGVGSVLELRAATARFEGCVWRGMQTALKLAEGAEAELVAANFMQNQTALQLGVARASLDGAEFRGNTLAIGAQSGAAIAAKGLLFDGNEIHAEAVQPIDLGAARFRDSTYQALTARLKGKVKIDWANVPEADNVFRRWSEQAWAQVYQALESKDLVQAATYLEELTPALDATGLALKAAVEILSGRPLQETESGGHRFVSVAREFQSNNPDDALLWMQDVRIPFEVSLADAQSRLYDEARRRAPRQLLQQLYTNAPVAAVSKALDLDPLRHERSRLILPGIKEGAYWHYRVVWLIDRTSMERDLRLAGVIEGARSNMVIGVLNQSDRAEASQRLADTLVQKKIRFINLGQGEFNAKAKRKAVEAGVQLVVETEYSVEVVKSRLSTTLKRFTVQLAFNVYDVQDGTVLQRFTASGSSMGFRDADGVEKALDEAISKIETDLLSTLWRLDEVRVARSRQAP